MARDDSSIPEIRGVTMSEERDEYAGKYSARSYAAQYGITLEDAQEIWDTTSNHGEAKRAITQMFANNPALAKAAMDFD